MKSRLTHNKSLSSHSDKSTGIINRSYIRNKKFNYPYGAESIEDSLHHPTEIKWESDIETISPIIYVPINAYASFKINTELGKLYVINTKAGYGSSNVIGNNLFAGTGKPIIFTVQVTGVGVSNAVQVGIFIYNRETQK